MPAARVAGSSSATASMAMAMAAPSPILTDFFFTFLTTLRTMAVILGY